MTSIQGGMVNRHLKIVVPFILLVYLGVSLAANFAQSHVIFRSNDIFYAPPRKLAIEEITIQTRDGQKLYAWWLKSETADKTILFFKGNGRNISYEGSRLKTFKAMGVNALLVDYRGYGKSTGRIKMERDIYADGAAAFRYLVGEKRIPPGNIIIWGRSLGGGVATETALAEEAAALVLESTFYSMDEMAQRKYWYLPTRLFLKFHFANGEKLSRINIPVVIIHSVEDGYIPFSQAARLFAVANEPKTLIKTRGSHIDSFERYTDDLNLLRKRLHL